MGTETIFRCPFEEQGIKTKTILNVTLPLDPEERLSRMCAAVQSFRSEHSWIAVRLTLPETVMADCDSHVVLKGRIVPYQVECLAAMMDSGLYPFLQHHPRHERWLAWFDKTLRFRKLAAIDLRNALSGFGPRSLNSRRDFVDALSAMFEDRAKVCRHPSFALGSEYIRNAKLYTIQFDLSAFGIIVDPLRVEDTEVNDTLFTVVKSPLYPQAFGRYSERVEIVITRDVDVARLPNEVRQKLRRQANEVHKAHGVHVCDLDFDYAPTGYWIPGENNVLKT